MNIVMQTSADAMEKSWVNPFVIEFEGAIY